MRAVLSTTAGFRATYDANGHMTQRVEVSGTQRITYTQEWDAGHRLAVVTATVGGVTQFAYDGDGARVQQVHASGITATTYTCDAANRLTSDGVFTYTAAGQWVRAQRVNATLGYTYTADGLRVAQRSNGAGTPWKTW